MKTLACGINYYTPDEITDEMLAEIAKGETVTKVVRKKEIRYHADPSTFDIEATNLKYIRQAVMYVWQWKLDDLLIVGRTWSEFRELFERVQKALKDIQLVIYVHNLSYEFCFLAGIMNFYTDDVFAVGSHKVLYARKGNVEFRCSYKLTNMSLDMFTRQFHVKHGKLSGMKYNYKKERFPWTQLTDEELHYCVNDVLGLHEAILALYARDGDDVATVPYTSTGYVRREVKQAMELTGEAKKLRWKSSELMQEGERHTQKKLPNFEIQKMLRAAFRGGNTHANRYYITRDGFQVIIPGVFSYDRSSSYPDVICNCQFPVGNWYKVDGAYCNLNTLLSKISRGYAVIVKIALYSPKLKKNKFIPVPYISSSKCDGLLYDAEVESDNGRVMSADYLEMTITDVDFRIIDSQYDWRWIEVLEMAYCKYGPLPKAVTDKVKEYYTKKTALKGDPEQEQIYAKAKALLNAIYGMTCQDPCKDLYEYDEADEFERAEPESAKEIRKKMKKATGQDLEDLDSKLTKILQDYYEKEYEDKMNYAFLSYAWGVWTAAWARYRLQEAIDIAGDRCVYVDTDSVKTIGPLDLSEYNAERIADSKKNGAFAVDAKGVTHYMGVFEEEPDNYGEKFVTMGAKKYAYIGKPLKISDDYKEWAKDHGYSVEGINLHITIAGVSKTAGAIEMWNKGGIESFQEGFLFEDAGGLQAVYNSRKKINGLVIEKDGHKLEVTPNVYLEESEYKLGLDGDFERMLASISFTCADLIKKWRIGI